MSVSIKHCERNFSISFVQMFKFEHWWLRSTVGLGIGFMVTRRPALKGEGLCLGSFFVKFVKRHLSLHFTLTHF